jgi:hypothetical protein
MRSGDAVAGLTHTAVASYPRLDSLAVQDDHPAVHPWDYPWEAPMQPSPSELRREADNCLQIARSLANRRLARLTELRAKALQQQADKIEASHQANRRNDWDT